MKIVPSEKISYKSNLPVEELKKILSENLGQNSKYFKGNINGNHFQITRNISYRNSFLPNIEGKFEEKNTFSEITLDFKLVTFVKVFMIFWMAMTTLGFLATLIYSILNKEFNPSILFIGFMPIAGFAMTHIGFNQERKIAAAKLKQIFSAEVIIK